MLILLKWGRKRETVWNFVFIFVFNKIIFMRPTIFKQQECFGKCTEKGTLVMGTYTPVLSRKPAPPLLLHSPLQLQKEKNNIFTLMLEWSWVPKFQFLMIQNTTKFIRILFIRQEMDGSVEYFFIIKKTWFFLSEITPLTTFFYDEISTQTYL